MKRKLTLFVFSFTLTFFLHAQQSERYSRIKIFTGENGLEELAAAGVAVDHGERKKGHSFTSDFSEQEIRIIREKGFRYEVLIEDVVDYYQKQNISPEGKPADVPQTNALVCYSSNSFPTPANFKLGSMGGYFTYNEILAHLDTMAKKFPGLIKARQPIGTKTSHQGRPLYWLKISDNPNVDENEPEVMYNAVHHAREAASVSQLIMYMYYLLENYNTNPEVKFLVDNTEMYFVPLVNPDGYVYNQNNNPNGGGMWRKNRRNNGNNEWGVDLNRNYGKNWGYDNNGSSPNASSDTYRGPSAFSEPETQIMKEFCEAHQFQVALNYHTYGNLLIYPWGYTNNLFTPDSAQYVNYAKFLTMENHYTYGTPNQTVNYNANGGSDDWMYGEQGSKPKIFAMTPEAGLPSDGGFWPPQSKIIDICKNNIRQNLNLALLVTTYAEAKDDEPIYLPQVNGYLNYSLTKLGMQSPASYTVSFEPLSNEINSTGSPQVFSTLVTQQQVFDSISYALIPNITTGTLLKFVLTVDNGSYIKRDTLTKRFGPSVVEFSDNCNTMNAWNTASWGVSTATSVSAPGSLTESPSGNYAANENSTITAKKPLNLTNAISARIRFQAKWQTETNYDFAQFQVSEDGGTAWQALCGKYTKAGNGTAEDNGNPVYDGFMFGWVKEEISLDNYIGKNINIRFRFISENGSEFDGFNVDDIVVDKMVAASTGIRDPDPAHNFSLDACYPNPAQNILYADYNLPAGSNGAVLQMVNLLGETVMEKQVSPSEKNIRLDISSLQPGTYFCRIIAGQEISKAIMFNIMRF